VGVGTVKISETDKPFGMMMMGVPGNPQLLLSRSVYETFSSDEMEYVLLHEAGHYALHHSVKELLAGIILLVIGMKILSVIKGVSRGVLASVLIGLLFGVTMIRLGAHNEIEADHYSVTLMTNPEGMISATEKFRDYYENNFTRTDNTVLKWMFYRGNPYDNRIRMAQEQIK
jgi:Zn-dependent protease with chaperone function